MMEVRGESYFQVNDCSLCCLVCMCMYVYVCMYVCSSYGHLTLCKVNVCGGCCKDFPGR